MYIQKKVGKMNEREVKQAADEQEHRLIVRLSGSWLVAYVACLVVAFANPWLSSYLLAAVSLLAIYVAYRVVHQFVHVSSRLSLRTGRWYLIGLTIGALCLCAWHLVGAVYTNDRREMAIAVAVPTLTALLCMFVYAVERSVKGRA